MQALRNPRVYLFAFIYFSLTCASLTLNFWMPLMIRDFGVHDVLAISLYTVIPNAVGAVGLILIARTRIVVANDAGTLRFARSAAASRCLC
jgi:hypothetical protein